MGGKGNFGEKEKNGCGYQKASAQLLRVLSEFLKALREGGSFRSSVTPPIIKIEPYWVREMEQCRDCEEQSSDRPEADAFLHDNKHIPRCADSRQLKEGPQNALFSRSTATHCVDASFTCCTLRAAPPLLAGIRGHRQLDPQSLAAAGGMVDRGINHLINGVEQTGDILQNKGGRGESLQIAFMWEKFHHLASKDRCVQRQKHTFSSHSDSYHYAVWKLCAFKLSIINLMLARNLKCLRQQ